MRDRSVAALTDAQLHRKRAMDRKNQRESRNIRRARIEELEEEVKDLQQRLEAAENRVRVHEAREASMRQLAPDATWGLQDNVVSSATSPSTSTYLDTPACSTSSLDGQQHSFEQANEPLALHFTTSARPISAAPGHGNGQAWDPGCESASWPSSSMSLWLSDNIPTSVSPSLPGVQGSTFEFISTGLSQAFEAPGPYMYATIPIQTSLPAPIEMPAGSSRRPPQDSLRTPPWRRLPTHIAPTCPADTVLLEMVRAGRQQLANATESEALSEQSAPSLSSVLDTEMQATRGSGSSPPWTFANAFSCLKSDTERVGMMFQLCNYVRWLIAPSEKTFLKIPTFFRPTDFELSIPHAIWIDLIPWPEIREAVIRQNLDPSQADPMQQAIVRAWSFRHQYANNQIFSFRETGDVRVAASFERYIGDLNNHLIGDEPAQLWPFLSPAILAIQARRQEEGYSSQ